jgi:uncharacterized membrane protein YbaN (DUF454 family)
MKKILWQALGIICVGMAYVGVIVPGIPFSIFLVCAAYCFSKSSKRMHDWLYSHPLFGEFLTNWEEKRIFPTNMKYVMVLMMTSTVIITHLVTGNIFAVFYSSTAMILVAIWAWRFPGSNEEHQRRIDAGKRIAWLK